MRDDPVPSAPPLPCRAIIFLLFTALLAPGTHLLVQGLTGSFSLGEHGLTALLLGRRCGKRLLLNSLVLLESRRVGVHVF